MKLHMDRLITLEENQSKIFALIIDEYCSRAITSRLEAMPDYESKIQDNPVELLKAIQMTMSAPLQARYMMESATDALVENQTNGQRVPW